MFLKNGKQTYFPFYLIRIHIHFIYLTKHEDRQTKNKIFPLTRRELTRVMKIINFDCDTVVMLRIQPVKRSVVTTTANVSVPKL